MATSSSKKYIVVELKTTGDTKQLEKSVEQVVKDLRRFELQLVANRNAYKELAKAKKEADQTGWGELGGSKKSLGDINKLIAKNNEQYRRYNTNIATNRKAFNAAKEDAIKSTYSIQKAQEAKEKAIQKQIEKTRKEEEKRRLAEEKAAAKAATKAEKEKQSLSEIAKEVITVAAAYQLLKTSITFLIKTYTEFEYTMMNVQTLLDRTDRTLKSGSIQLMKDYGFTIKDVNEALYEAISTMIPARSSIAFLNDAARLAVGGVTSLATAVDGLTSIINAYGLEVSEAGRVADAFFRAQKWAKATVEELVDDIGRIAPVASIAGISYQEMLGAISELTLGGLDARESVTVLRQAIAGLIKPAAGAEAALRKYNVPVGIAQVSNAGLAYSLGKIMEAYAEFPDVVAEMIPNIRAFTGVTALTAKRLENMVFITKDINENWGEFSSLSMAVAKQMTTTEMKYRKFRGELNAIGVEVGTKLKPALEWLMKNFREIGTVVISLTASLATFVVTSTVIPNIFRAIAASFRAASIAGKGFAATLGWISGGLSLLIGLFSSWLIASKTNTNQFVKSWRNIAQQIDSTKESLKYWFDALNKVNEELKTASGEEYNKLIKERNDIIMELNTNYGEYLDSLITEKMSQAELNQELQEANEKIEANIALRMRQQAIQDANLKWAEDSEPRYQKLYDSMLNAEKSNGDAIMRFTANMDKLFNDFDDKIKELSKTYSGDQLKGMVEFQKEILFTDIATLFEAGKFGKLNKVNGEYIPASPKEREQLQAIKDLINARLDNATAIAEMTRAMEAYNDEMNRSLGYQRKLIREYTSEEMYSAKTIGFTMGEKMTYDEFVTKMNALPPEYDEWKKELMQEYLTLYNDLANTIKTGSGKVAGDMVKGYEQMTYAERAGQPELIEKERLLTDAYNRMVNALNDEQKKYIDSFNFYAKEALDYTKALTAEQMRDLPFLIKKWYNAMRKEVIANQRAIINLQMDFMEDSANTFQTGYDKELTLQSVAYARRVAQLELSLDSEREKTQEFIDNMQLYQRPKELALINEQLAEYEELNSKRIMQAHRVLLYQRERTMIEIKKSLNEFRTNFEFQGDVIKELELQLIKGFESMIKSFSDLLVGSDAIIKPLLQELQDMGINVDLNGKISDEDLAWMDDEQLKSFLKVFKELQDLIEKFRSQSAIKTGGVKNQLLSDFGILTIDKKQAQDTIVFYEKLEANINNLTEAEKRLAEQSFELAKAEEKLQYRQDLGIAKYQEQYDVELARLNLLKDNGDISTGEFDVLFKKLGQDIPRWIRNMSEPELEKLKAIANRTAEIISSTIDGVFQLQADASQRQYERDMEQINDKHQTELDLLKNRLDKGLVSEERYNKEKEKIDAKYRRREEELKRRQFEQEKKRAIAQAIINGAIAAVRSFADMGPIGGWIGVALTAAETAAQVAIIAAQKYKKGGLIGGKKHEQGGTKFYGEDGSVFEAEQGELMAIINAKDTKILQALSGINSMHGNSFYGNGGIVDGGLFQRDLLNSINKGITVDELVAAFEKLPNPVVRLDELNKKNNRLIKIENAARG